MREGNTQARGNNMGAWCSSLHSCDVTPPHRRTSPRPPPAVTCMCAGVRGGMGAGAAAGGPVAGAPGGGALELGGAPVLDHPRAVLLDAVRGA